MRAVVRIVTATPAQTPSGEGQLRRRRSLHGARSGKFVVEKDPGGKYRLSLMASNGQVIATSAAYERRQAALNGIEAVKKNAPDAEIASQDGE